MPVRFSIIVPCHNAAGYLDETLCCLAEQTETNLEIICVEDHSTDATLLLLRQWAEKDNRIRVLAAPGDSPIGAGAARNIGFEQASGQYTLFFDSDDLCSRNLLERTGAIADRTNADVVAFRFDRLYADGTREETGSIHFWPPKEQLCFNYKDCPDFIMSAINPTPWNKLYRTSFLRAHHLRFDEISSTNDIAFSAISVASAQSIALCNENLMTYRAERPGSITTGKAKNLDNVILAVESAVRQAEQLPYADEIARSIRRFEADNYAAALRNYAPRIETPQQERYYQHIHQRLALPQFNCLLENYVYGDNILDWLQIIRQNDLESYRNTARKEIVVSLTSYPARISSVAAAVSSLGQQLRKPDRIVLYLARDQFPRREKDLPLDLAALIRAKKVELRWVDGDIGPHKKYFYALQEFDNALVVTIDDDLIYPDDMIDNLYKTHLRHPRSIPTMRAHFITYDSTGKVKPYKQWLMEFDGLLELPSMRLLATGGAGALYPTDLFKGYPFSEIDLLENAPNADDLWLKFIETSLGIPVTLTAPHTPLRYLPDTQEVGLYHQNLDKGENDTQWTKIAKHYGQMVGADFSEDIRDWSHEHSPYENEMLLGYFATVLDKQRLETAEANQEIELIHTSKTWKAGRFVSLPLRAARLAFRKISGQDR